MTSCCTGFTAFFSYTPGLAVSLRPSFAARTGLDAAPRRVTHVLNLLLSFILADVVVLLLGFSPEALLILAPFNIVYSSMVHANLNWTFGPLRFVFASPVFHRWHHTAEGTGINKNFAPTFPVLDLLFGTFYMPPGEVPQHFGNGDHEYPEDFWGQFIHPFLKKRPSRAAETVDQIAPREAA